MLIKDFVNVHTCLASSAICAFPTIKREDKFKQDYDDAAGAFFRTKIFAHVFSRRLPPSGSNDDVNRAARDRQTSRKNRMAGTPPKQIPST